MLAGIRSQLTYANVVATICLFVVLGGTGVAAPVADTAATLGTSVKRALGLSKKANKNATRALKTAKAALAKGGPPGPQGATGTQGPVGPQGPKGDQGEPGLSNGPAGGDLTGNYPNPTIGANKVTAGKVADDTLTGADLVESSLGQVPSAADADKLDGKDSTDFIQAGGAAGGDLTGSYPNPAVGPNSVGGPEVVESSLSTVPSAGTAVDAQKLGGVAAADYQRRCSTGSVVLYARIKGEASGFPSTYTSSTTYIDRTLSCVPNSTLRVKRDATGTYSVLIDTGSTIPLNDPFPKHVVGTVDPDPAVAGTAGNDNFLSIEKFLNAFVVRTYDDDSGPQDSTFSVVGVF